MGTPPREITNTRTDMDVLGCVHPALAGEYDGEKFRTDLVRTFVKVDSDLPPEFGLTQAVASLPKKTAGALLDDYRSAIDDCPDRDASSGTEVRGPQGLRRRRRLVHRLAPEHPAPQRADVGVLRRLRPQRLGRLPAGVRLRARARG